MKKEANSVIAFFKNKPIIEYVFVSLFFIIASVCFASKMDLLTCGIHFADDYEIIDINNFIKSNGLWLAISKYVIQDLSWRFRPLYFVVRVLRTFFLGDNYFYWHLLIAIETGVYISASYILARKMKAPFITSFIFAFIYLIGFQDEIIWRLGPQEPLALLFLIFALLFVVIYHENNQKVYGVLSTMNIIFMSLYKESFLILAPAVILFLFYLEVRDNVDEKDDNLFKQLWSFIVKHSTMIISTIIALLISAADILFYTGLFDNGYAGIDANYSFKDYIHLTLNVFIRDLKDWWIVIGLGFVLIIYAVIKRIVTKQVTKQYMRYVFVGLVFAGYSMVAEAVIYGVSTMFLRYYIPCVWLIYFVSMIMEANILKPIVSSAIAILLIISALYMFDQKEASVYMDALYFAEEGKNTTKMFEYIETQIEEINNPIVITKFDTYEQNCCVAVYLQNKTDSKAIYYIDEDREDGDYKNIYKDDGTRIAQKDGNIIVANSSDKFSEDKYDIKKFDRYVVAVKK